MVRDLEHILSAHRYPDFTRLQSVRSLRPVISLHPGLVGKDVVAGENQTMVQAFLNQFIKVNGNYLRQISRAWLGSLDKEAVVEPIDKLHPGPIHR